MSQRTGRCYEAILTEAGLALMYKYPNSMDQGGLCTPPELDAKMVSQDDYWRSLTWLNDILLHDDFARGDWATFRHFGQDNTGQLASRPISFIKCSTSWLPLSRLTPYLCNIAI